MNQLDQKHTEIRCYLGELVGDIDVKHLFGSQGLFYQGKVLFGVLHHSSFYLKAKDSFADKLKALGGIAFPEIEPSAAFTFTQYYCLPEHIFKDKKLFGELLKEAIHLCQLRK